LWINEAEKVQTKTRMKTLAPVWGEDFGFYHKGKPSTIHLNAQGLAFSLSRFEPSDHF